MPSVLSGLAVSAFTSLRFGPSFPATFLLLDQAVDHFSSCLHLVCASGKPSGPQSRLFFRHFISSSHSLISFKMPSLRGIEISISTSPDDERIPEYPHPEGSRCPARSFSQTVPDDIPKSLATTFHPTPAQYHKYGPSVSVYIPSVSGEVFDRRWCRGIR